MRACLHVIGKFTVCLFGKIYVRYMYMYANVVGIERSGYRGGDMKGGGLFELLRTCFD